VGDILPGPDCPLEYSLEQLYGQPPLLGGGWGYSFGDMQFCVKRVQRL
jgi:hypothetical protein